MKTISCATCDKYAEETITTNVITLENCKIIIDNVPCFKCIECGEVMYFDNIVEQIENITKVLENDMGAIIYAEYNKCMESISIKSA